MLRLTWLLCGIFLMANIVAKVSAENDEVDRAAAQFLKERVNGKTLAGPETIERIDNGKVESVISTRFQYRNFTETKSGFYFDEESTFVQTLYDLDADGKRTGPGLKKDRSFIKRYQVGQRRSTKELIGITFVVNDKGQVIAEDESDYPFSPCSVYIQMKDGHLIVKVTTVLYQDLFAKGGKWRPGIEEDVSVFSVKDGKLQRVLKTKGYDVDPRTLEKKLSDDLPEEIHKEVGEVKVTEVDGTWRLLRYIESGKSREDIVSEDYIIVRRAGLQEITKGGQNFSRRKYEVDAGKSPKQLNFVDDHGLRTLAIYEMKGEELWLAQLADPNKSKSDRPSDLKEEGSIIAVYKRVTGK